MYADYHLHCSYSDDSDTPIPSQIEQGIKIGLSELCFTDHVDYGVKKDWSEGNIIYRNVEGNRREPMANVDYPDYFRDLKTYREQYKDRIAVKSGLEFGIQTHTIPNYEALYRTWQEELDFVLLSVHQVEDCEFWTGDYQKGRTQEEYNLRYYQEIYDVMNRFHDYCVLAHLDLIIRYDEQGVFPFERTEDIIAEILKLAIREGKGIEINTSSWRYGLSDTQPSGNILKLYRDLGGRIITTGSDAHKPEQLGAHFKEAHHILRGLGYTQFCTYDHMEPVFHDLED